MADPTSTPSSSPPTSAPPTAPSSSLRKLFLILRSRTSSSLSTTDILLLRLCKLLSTPSGIDATLATIGYSSTLLHSYLSRRLDRQLTILAESIASKASDVLQPGETLLAEFPAPPEAAALARRTERCKKLADLISDYRIFVRLWGLLGMYAWGRATYLQPPEDKVVRTITWAQVAVNTAFQVLENGAYLAQHGILNGERWSGEQGTKRQTWWWVWSSRFWAAHVGLEFARLGYVALKAKESNAKGDEGEKEDKIRRKEENAAWWREVVSNGAYAPMTIHWGLEDGLISDATVGVLGTIAGIVNLSQNWKATA